MNNIVMPFLMSMLLGRTIDLSSYTIGSNIYDDADYVETPVNTVNATYLVLQDHQFPYTFFGLPVDIVLRIKTNFLSTSSGNMGLDGLLKDTSWKYNSVIVAVTALYRTVDRQLKKGTPLLSDWQSRISSSQTHYANTLTYGGWSIVLFRFRCDVGSDVEAVRDTLINNLGVIGMLEKETQGKWNKAIEAVQQNPRVRGKVTVSTHVYSTATLDYDVDSSESLMDAVQNLPKAVGKLGMPMFMELKPLHDLDDSFPVAEESMELLDELERIDDMFDDVKNTKMQLMKWLLDTSIDFTDEEKETISKLLGSVNNLLREFYSIGADVSLFKNMDSSILEKVFSMYYLGLGAGIPNYYIAYKRLKEDMDADCKDEFHQKVKGLLTVEHHRQIEAGEVKEGLEECKRLCLTDQRCRSIGYGDQITKLDLSTGLYMQKDNQCWVYFRSSTTAAVSTPSGMSGDIGVYDRKCFI